MKLRTEKACSCGSLVYQRLVWACVKKWQNELCQCLCTFVVVGIQHVVFAAQPKSICTWDFSVWMFCPVYLNVLALISPYGGCVHSLSHTVEQLFCKVCVSRSWLNIPQKETTESQQASKQIPKMPFLTQRPSILKEISKSKLETCLELLNTQKTMDEEIREARIWKPNFAKITSASSQKKIPAEIDCRKNQACSSQKQFWVSIEKTRRRVEINGARNGQSKNWNWTFAGTHFFADGVWGLGIWAPATHGNSKQIISKNN